MNAVIIEDDKISMTLLEELLRGAKTVKHIKTFADPLLGKEYILKHKTDVVFLDIHFDGVNGIELAEQLFTYKPELIVVFVTSYDKFAVDAFELNAVDYLLKPIKPKRFQLTLERITRQLQKVSGRKHSDLLYVYTSNQLMFETRDNHFETLEWRTAKAQELFLYLLLQHNKVIRRDVLIELLWSDYDMEKAYSLLYTTVYHVRSKLKKFAHHFSLQNINEGYMLKLNDVHIDLVEWEKRINQLPALSKSSVHQYEELIIQNDGPYLANEDFLWAETEKYRLEKEWINLALKTAVFYEENKQFEKALNIYSSIINRSPETEQAYFRKMKIYAKNQNHKAVYKEYSTLAEMLDSHLGVTPSYYVKEWFNNWEKDN